MAVLYPAAALSLIAALVHLAVTPEHLSEWWGYGAFFLAAALGVLLFWRLLRERVGLVLLVAATALLTLAHLPHLILLFRLL